MTDRRTFIRTGVAAGAVLTTRARAQDRRPIAIVVGFPPGGSPDFVARTLAEKLATRLGRPVIVENRAGAGGQLALAAVHNGPADGTVYALTPPGMLVTYPTLFPKLPYDVSRLDPVITACSFEFAIAASNGTPVRTLPEMLAWAKANPGKASYGIPAAGTSPHFIGMLLARTAGVDLQSVAYRGGPPMVADLLGGQIPLAINVASNFVEQHRAGRLRVLATTGEKRSPLLQDVPTVAEAGMKSLQVDEWYAFVARSGTPKTETSAFAAAVREVVELRDVRTALLASGHVPMAVSGDALTREIEASTRRWTGLIRDTGFKLES